MMNVQACTFHFRAFPAPFADNLCFLGIQPYGCELDHHTCLLHKFEVNRITSARLDWHINTAFILGGGAITWGNSNVFSFVTILVMPQILESWHICYVDDKWPTPKKLGFLSKFSEAHHPQSWKAAWGHFRRFPLFMEQTTCAQPSPYPDEKIPTRIGHQSERYWLLHFAPTFILFLTKMTQKWTKTITTKMKIKKIKF